MSVTEQRLVDQANAIRRGKWMIDTSERQKQNFSSEAVIEKLAICTTWII